MHIFFKIYYNIRESNDYLLNIKYNNKYINMFDCMLNKYYNMKYKSENLKIELKNKLYLDLLQEVYQLSNLDNYLIDKYIDSKTLYINPQYLVNLDKCTLDIQIDELNRLIKYPNILKTLEKKHLMEQNLIKSFKRKEAEYLTALYFLNKNNIPYNTIDNKSEIIKLFKTTQLYDN